MKVLNLSLMCGENGFTKAFRKRASEYIELKPNTTSFNEEVQNITLQFKPDLVFIQIQASNIISEQTVKILKGTGAFVVNFTGDVRHPIPQWFYEIGKHIDLTLFSNMTDVKQFRNDGLKADYLEIGYDPEIFKPEGDKLLTRDIVFLGNTYGAGFFPLSKMRIQMVAFLKYHYPHDFGLYGNGWEVCNGNFNHSQHEEAKLYRGAKIAINLSHYDYERYNSDRILRIMGTGTPLCLTKNYKGLKEDYSPGVNVATWDDFDELKQNIDFYLKNEKIRKEIALHGNELVKNTFTFDNMIDNIINLVK